MGSKLKVGGAPYGEYVHITVFGETPRGGRYAKTIEFRRDLPIPLEAFQEFLADCSYESRNEIALPPFIQDNPEFPSSYTSAGNTVPAEKGDLQKAFVDHVAPLTTEGIEKRIRNLHLSDPITQSLNTVRFRIHKGGDNSNSALIMSAKTVTGANIGRTLEIPATGATLPEIEKLIQNTKNDLGVPVTNENIIRGIERVEKTTQEARAASQEQHNRRNWGTGAHIDLGE